MTKPLRLGIAGLGTVGVGVIKIIQNKLPLLEARTGRKILISAISAQNLLSQTLQLAIIDGQDAASAVAEGQSIMTEAIE